MTDANNFASLNLTNLEEFILTSSCVLKLYCKNFNIRVVRLETEDGKLVASGEGFSIIPNLEKLSEQGDTLERVLLNLRKLSDQKKNLDCILPFSHEIVDTPLGYQILSGAKVTIKRISPCLLTAIVEDWNDDILYTGDHANLSTLLSMIDEHFQ